MIAHQNITDLRAEIAHTRSALESLCAEFDRFRREEYVQLGKRRITAVYLADAFDTFYTCVETLFFRIAEAFGNSLSQGRWHKDLLERMRIEVPGVRPAVIGAGEYRDLQELLKFRHFNRYYYDRDYDWDKLAFLEQKYLDARKAILTRMEAFDAFLAALIEELGE